MSKATGTGIVLSKVLIMNRALEVFIVSYARTPMGSFQGALSSLPATELGAVAIKGALKKAGLSEKPQLIDHVYGGNVLSSGLGQNPPAIAARLAGIPSSTPTTLINKVSTTIAANAIKAGEHDIVVACGFESMSRAPMILPVAARTGGLKYGDQTILDSLRYDGLTDSATDWGMGLCGEKCAEDYGFDRSQSDEYAKGSYTRAQKAQSDGFFAGEIVPVTIPGSRGKPDTVIEVDEGIKNFNPEKMTTLKPSFKPNGTVTAANASPMNDGASALVVASSEAVKRHQLPTMAKIIGYADAQQAGVDFTTAPAVAIPKALEKAGLTIDQVDFFEINEAFSVVALANMKILGIPHEKINVCGGSVALGHPLGSSGARIVGTLARILQSKGAKYGVAAVCNGGGGASAIVIENANI